MSAPSDYGYTCGGVKSAGIVEDRILWMGDLRPYMNSSFIMKAFEMMGIYVVSVRVIADRAMSHRAGYCFLELRTNRQARECMLLLNGQVIPGTDPPVKFNLSFANNPESGVREFNLFINNLAPNIDDAALYQLFGIKYRSCRGAKVYRNYDGSSRGMGFVRFSDETDQQRALVEFNRKRIWGRPISLKLAPERVRPPRPRRGRNGPYFSPKVFARCPVFQQRCVPYRYTPSVRPNYPAAATYNYTAAASTSSGPAYVPSVPRAVAEAADADDLLEYYDDGLSVEEANELFMESSEELYAAVEESRNFPLFYCSFDSDDGTTSLDYSD